MRFWQKLFGRPEEKPAVPPPGTPENTRLNDLLTGYGQQPSAAGYQAVMQEILEGNSYLLLPSAGHGTSPGAWHTLPEGSVLTLASVFDLDGLKVLGAFSDEYALLSWTKQKTEYTALRTQDVMRFCEQHGFDRVVINSNQESMFVLERSRENIREIVIEEETQVLVGTPQQPLPAAVVAKLQASFRRVATITEAYQYAQQLNGEMSLVVGVVLAAVSDDSRAALQNAVNTAVQGEQLPLPLDVLVLETPEWLNTVRGIPDSLFYTR